MRYFLCLTVSATFIFFFQNCQEIGTTAGAEAVVSNLSDVADWKTLTLENDLQRSQITFDSEAETLKIETLRGGVGGGSVTCSVPGDILSSLKDLWARASICRTQYILPPDTAVCMAFSQPYAHFADGDSFVSLQGTICYADKISLCDAADQGELEDIIRALWERKDSLSCN